jgi:hypothetical protein
MKNYRIISIWFLVSLLVFAITPKDIFHEFHNHQDEIEHIDLDCHNQHFEKKHSHCPVLNQVAPVFFVSAHPFFIPFVQSLTIYVFKAKLFFKTPTHFMFSLKAPPYCFIRVC